MLFRENHPTPYDNFCIQRECIVFVNISISICIILVQVYPLHPHTQKYALINTTQNRTRDDSILCQELIKSQHDYKLFITGFIHIKKLSNNEKHNKY